MVVLGCPCHSLPSYALSAYRNCSGELFWGQYQCAKCRCLHMVYLLWQLLRRDDSTLYQQFNSLYITGKGYEPVEVAAIRQQLSEEMRKINALKLEIMFFTDIYAMTAGCSACKKPCRVQSILPEFQKIYEKVGSKLFELLQIVDAYVVVSVSNALYQALITNCQQSNQRNQALGQPPEYSEAEIEIHKSKIIDIEPQRENLLALMNEVSKYNQNEIQQLSALAREYIAIKQQNAYKKCFHGKED